MNVTIPKDTLTKALARVQGVLKRDSNPLLGCVLLRAFDSKLVITATDTQITLIAEYAANVFQDGEIAVSGQTLYQIVKTLPSADVDLEMGKGKGRLRVSCGSYQSHLNVHSADDFPPVQRLDKAKAALTIAGGALARLIDFTHFAVATDENRYGLNGAHLETRTTGDGSLLRMVATDGSRLSYAEAPFEGKLALSPRTLLPLKGLLELRKVIASADETWTLSFHENAVSCSTPGVRLDARLISGEFPDYRQVLPERFARSIQIERGPLEAAVRRVALFASDKNHTTKFVFEDSKAVISAENFDAGDGQEEVPCTLEGESLTTGFNIQYLQDLLNATKGATITLTINGEVDPCVVRFKDEDDLYGLVMPMRLN